MSDLVVLGQDPRFGGGALAQTEAFLEGARALGRSPRLVYSPHPTFDGRRFSPDRLESVRLWRASRALRAQLPRSGSFWVVSTLAAHGGAAPGAGAAYGAWLGTTLADEWAARARGLDPLRRLTDRVNAPVLGALERRVIRGAARVLATTPASRAAVAAAGGLDEAAVGILPIPVDVDALVPEPDERWLARLEAPTLVFVGRADDPRKNAALLLDALPAIRARLPGARLRLVGRPPEHVPEGVDALGPVPSIAPVLREASLFVLPSWQEGFGIVAAEALAAGVPVLTTPCGGPEHLVRASGGGVVLDGFDAGELAAAAVELLTDAGTLSRMRASGREYVVREHSPARFRSLLADLIDLP